MNRSVLVGTVAVTGLAASALGQISSSNLTAGNTYELRWVIDGRAGAPGDPGSQQFPYASDANPLPDRVGLTLQARVIRGSGVPNWGISSFTNGSGTNYSQFLIVDPAATTPGAPSSASMERGRSGAGTEEDPFFHGALNPFRGIFTEADSGVGATDNATNANLATSTGVRNGFFDQNNDRMRGMDLNQGVAVTGLTNAARLPRFDLTSPGDIPWQNLYRVVVATGDAGANVHQITLNASGFLLFFYAETRTGTGAAARFNMLGGSQAFGASTSITFGPVPAPGALALLGLGGLAAARRRR